MNQDHSVLGYYVLNETNSKYNLYIQADGKIKANPNASYYFASSYWLYDGSRNGYFHGVENIDTS